MCGYKRALREFLVAMELFGILTTDVNVLVRILYYSFTGCYHWEKLGEVCMRSLYCFLQPHAILQLSQNNKFSLKKAKGGGHFKKEEVINWSNASKKSNKISEKCPIVLTT